MRSSKAAVNLIVAEEVSSKATYIKKYQKPVWPGVQSGITVGVGYDVGHQTKDKVRTDWTGLIPNAMVEELVRVTGLKGAAAQAQLAKSRRIVSVPWEAANSVFMNVDMPRWEGIVLRAIPAAKNLPPDCFGVIVSLTFNRGASYNTAGPRYAEMRAIKAAITRGDFDEVPGLIRAMKRLWPNVPGLLGRREREAALFEKGLKAWPKPNQSFADMGSDDDDEGMTGTDTGDDRSIEPVADAVEGGQWPPEAIPGPTHTPAAIPPVNPQINVQPISGTYSLDLEVLQGKLIGLRYYEIGDADGKFGGKTFAGVNAFLLDRGIPSDGLMDANGFTSGTAWRTVTTEVSKALAQQPPWTRPIAENRALATPAQVGQKVEAVRQNWFQKLWAWILGIFGTIGAGIKSIVGDDPSSWIGTIKSYAGMVPTELYFGAVVGIAILIYVTANKSQTATVRDYQEGRIN